MKRRELSADGIELTLAVNHFAHVLLTHLLLESHVGQSLTRVINVSSIAHLRAYIDLEDIENTRLPFDDYQAYATSKFANVLFTVELARRLKSRGTLVNAVHPGVVSTKLLETGFDMRGPDSLGKGARTSVMLAISPNMRTFPERTSSRGARAACIGAPARRTWPHATTSFRPRASVSRPCLGPDQTLERRARFLAARASASSIRIVISSAAGHAARLPQFREHRDRGEAGQRVDFVHVPSATLVQEQIHARQPVALQGAESGERQLLHRFNLGGREVGRDLGLYARAVDVFGGIGIEAVRMVDADFARQRRARNVTAEDCALDLARVVEPELDHQLVVELEGVLGARPAAPHRSWRD